MKLFTVGPAEMYPNTLQIRSQEVPYFRTPEFSNIMLENQDLIKKIMYASDDSKVVFLTASGSAAMEATVINCFSQKDKVLIISGGTFGERFEQICQIHDIPYQALKLGQDEELQECHFSKFEDQGFTALLVNLHETYTGQLYDINIISDFCKRNNLFLIVDAISTFLCDEYYMDKYGIDATIISSQKGLCLSPGLSCITLSSRIIQEKILVNNVRSLYFDFKDCLTNMERGQTPFTPCVGILLELNDMLKYIDKKGVENHIDEVGQRCNYFRSRIVELPVHLPPYKLSNAITPIRFKQDIAMDLFLYLKNEKSIMVNPVGGELGKCSIRVAHIGNLTFEDYDLLISEIGNFITYHLEIK